MKHKTRKHRKIWIVLLCLLAALTATALIFMHFGGFDTGKSANVEQFAAYAKPVSALEVSPSARVIALGEASHGNVEFQQLKLDVFRTLVEKLGVRAFALEGDAGGCEQVNRYIHGGEGDARAAAAAIGFAFYRTDEMAALIDYMRQYNDTASEGDDLRFYGFDMQRYALSMRFLTEACPALGVDAAGLEALMDGDEWSDAFTPDERAERIEQAKAALEARPGSEQAVRFAGALLNYLRFQKEQGDDQGAMLRDKLMTDDVQWILRQENALGHERIFVSAHNMHVAKWASNECMGKMLADTLGGGYYCIGTDFYKTCCNLPVSRTERTLQTFYSHDPLAAAAHKAGLSLCWLDFASVPQDTELASQCAAYTYMGSLGESYRWIMRLLPPSYRIFQPPAGMYDSMIFVDDAHPLTILSES